MVELNKFYKTAKADKLGDGYGVYLDGRKLSTPQKKVLILPNLASAQLIADEWNAQKDKIDTNSMPITRLVNVAIDRAPLTRDALCDEVQKYASTDLLCYRTSSPEILYQNQCELWDCEIIWINEFFKTNFIAKTDCLDLFQTQETLNKIRDKAQNYDDLRLTILAFVTAIAGSAILGFGLVEGRLIESEIFQKIRIEEDHNAKIWGYDDDDLKKANGKLSDLKAARMLGSTLIN